MSNKILVYFIFLGLFLVIGSCAKTEVPQKLSSSKNIQLLTQNQSINPEKWRTMTAEETEQNWQYILNSPLGIAALNQLAIEGFISPDCSKKFYVNQQYDLFQTLLQVKCSSPRGVSIAVEYAEIRVIFNRFEDNIENFKVERIYVSQ